MCAFPKNTTKHFEEYILTAPLQYIRTIKLTQEYNFPCVREGCDLNQTEVTTKFRHHPMYGVLTKVRFTKHQNAEPLKAEEVFKTAYDNTNPFSNGPDCFE